MVVACASATNLTRAVRIKRPVATTATTTSPQLLLGLEEDFGTLRALHKNNNNNRARWVEPPADVFLKNVATPNNFPVYNYIIYILTCDSWHEM